MKNKKVTIGIIIIVLAIMIGIITFILLNKQTEKQANQTLEEYISFINEKNYEAMYEKVASMNMSKEDFIKRNQNIYEGIDSENIKVEIEKIQKENKTYKVSYHEKMVTSAGEVEFDNIATLKKEKKEIKIEWTSNLIFPQLGETDKVRVSTIKAKRGSILDRNGEILARRWKNIICRDCSRKTRR